MIVSLLLWHAVSSLCVRMVQDASPISISFQSRSYIKWIVLIDLAVSVYTFHKHPLNATVAWLLAIAFYDPFSRNENSTHIAFVLLMVRTEGIFLMYDPLLIISIGTAVLCVYVSVFASNESCCSTIPYTPSVAHPEPILV
jgi:hypothetical protein